MIQHRLWLRNLARRTLGGGQWPSDGLAIICVAVAAAVHFSISHSLGNISPTVSFYPAVFLAALAGGMRTGVIALLLSSVVTFLGINSPYFLSPASQTTALSNQILFVAAMGAVIWIAEYRRRSEPIEAAAGTPSLASRAATPPNTALATAKSPTHTSKPDDRRRSLQIPRSPYVLAIGLVGASTLLRCTLTLLGDDILPFACFYPGVLIATLVGGIAAGALTIGLSVVVVGLAFTPSFSFVAPTSTQVAGFGAFIAASVLSIWLGEKGHAYISQLRPRKIPVLELIAPTLVSICAVLLTTIVLVAIDSYLEAQHLILLYLLPTVFIATAYGSAFAFFASFASGLAAAYFLFPPKFSIYISQPLHVVELTFFVILALISSKVISELKRP